MIVWALFVFGVTLIVTGSTASAPLRRWITRDVSKTLGSFLSCPMCIGFWVGLIVGFTRFALSMNPFVDACAASALCWTWHLVLAKLDA